MLSKRFVASSHLLGRCGRRGGGGGIFLHRECVSAAILEAWESAVLVSLYHPIVRGSRWKLQPDTHPNRQLVLGGTGNSVCCIRRGGACLDDESGRGGERDGKIALEDKTDAVLVIDFLPLHRTGVINLEFRLVVVIAYCRTQKTALRVSGTAGRGSFKDRSSCEGSSSICAEQNASVQTRSQGKKTLRA